MHSVNNIDKIIYESVMVHNHIQVDYLHSFAGKEDVIVFDKTKVDIIIHVNYN